MAHWTVNRKIKQLRRRRKRKRDVKNEFALFQSSSLLFHLPQFVKCWRIFLELNSKGMYPSSEKEKIVVLCLRSPYTKREIRKFHVAVVQRRQRKVRTRVLHVQSCCFAYLNLIFFCRSRCRRRRRCLSSQYLLTPEMAGMVKCFRFLGFCI